MSAPNLFPRVRLLAGHFVIPFGPLLFAIGLLLAFGMASCEGRDPSSGATDLADDLMSEVNGPLVLVEGWIDPHDARSEITRFDRASGVQRSEVARSVEESATSVGEFSLAFRDEEGKELASQLIQPSPEAGGTRLRVSCYASLPARAQSIVLARAEKDGSWRELASRSVR